MNPIVLICTHERQEITTKNINSLLAQSFVPKIVLIVSEKKEVIYFRNNFPQINVIQFPNNPLGSKWQHGVHIAHKLEADPLIITGSDDILGDGYIAMACAYVQGGHDFIGIKQFWVHQNKHAFLVEYQASQPIGGGRIYSKQMLETIRYKIFNISGSRRLDDQGYELVKGSGLQHTIINEVEDLALHAIKGNWPMMNPFDRNHKNIKVLRSELSEKILKW